MKRKRKTTKKKKKKSPTQQWTLHPSLPDDLLLIIVARVSRLYYPTLSLVSKSFRSLLASPELYKVRSLLGHTESCLYVCLTLKSHMNQGRFTLCLKPDQNLTNDTSMKKKKKSSGYVLARVPILDSPCVHFSGLVVVGSNIYNIGKSINFSLSSSVSVLDCRSHTWREASSLPVKLISLSASVFDRKIYVAGAAGRYNDVRSDNLKTSLEVFDTKTQTWDPEPIPCSEIKHSFYCRSIWIDGKFHVATHKDLFAYKSKEGRWDTVEPRQAMHHYLYSDSYCKIDNVLYSASDGAFRWYDTDISMWRNLQGLVGLPKLLHLGYRVRLADYGGKLAVLWEEELPYYSGTFLRYEKMIWCAEISLERRKSWEIWGKVEWFDHMLTVPRTYELVSVLTTTV